MIKKFMFSLVCFFSVYSLTQKEEKERELSNMICEERKIQCIKFEDILEEVEYMKKKNLSWKLNQESELKNFHSTMNSYIEENKGAVFVDESGKKYTINDFKMMYRENIVYQILIGGFIFYKVAKWTYSKVKGYFSHDEEWQSNNHSNKKNQQDDGGRENI